VKAAKGSMKAAVELQIKVEKIFSRPSVQTCEDGDLTHIVHFACIEII
jgi:hypothetical protein